MQRRVLKPRYEAGSLLKASPPKTDTHTYTPHPRPPRPPCPPHPPRSPSTHISNSSSPSFLLQQDSFTPELSSRIYMCLFTSSLIPHPPSPDSSLIKPAPKYELDLSLRPPPPGPPQPPSYISPPPTRSAPSRMSTPSTEGNRTGNKKTPRE